jgi:Autotransporter beta-domain
MNRTKSILLAATALAMFAAPQLARAQSVATGVTILSGPATPAANGEIGPDSVIIPDAISADGTIVLGQVIPAGNVGSPVNNNIWTWVNGTPRIISITRPAVPGVEEARQFTPTDLSGDGRTITGALLSRAVLLDGTTLRTYTVNRAVYWTQASGLTLFPDLSPTEFAGVRGSNLSAYANNDGSLFAVSSSPIAYLPSGARNPAPVVSKVYRYSPTGGYQSLGSLGATISLTVSGINGAGDVIIGNSEDLAASNIDANGNFINLGAFRWDAASGLAQLPVLSAVPQNGALGRFARATDVSRDGSTIVGSSRGSDGRIQAVYWRASGIQALGFVPGFDTANATTIATATSRNGSIIGGDGTGGPWLWEAATGIQRLQSFVQNADIALNGFTFSNLIDISDTGDFITGFATNPAGGLDSFGEPLIARGFVLQIGRAAPTTLSTTAQLIVTLTLPGVTQTSIVNQTFSTQVDALLNGSNVFTRTVSDQITGTLGVSALADARASLQRTSGLRRLVIGAPTLVSSATTVLSSTSNTVNFASGTQITTANVISNGPTTVATGNLGTCATAAANGVNPTGCSLPGTPVAVNANVINTNTFTNTINAVTPTTTTTVNQLVSARWQVSATAGNQFGTVHALVGPAAFERGDRLIGQLLGMGDGGASASTGITRAAMPVHDESGLGGGESSLTMFGGYFGSRSSIDADISVPVARVKGNSDGFVLGLQLALGDAAHIGIAVDHGTSDYTVRDPLFPETLKLKHTQAAIFAGWSDGGFSLNGAASYGFGTARTSLLTPTTPATGSRDVNSWSVGAQAGYALSLGKDASLTPYIGTRYISAKLKGFTETGGPTPLLGLSQTVHRTRFYAGLEAKAGIDLGGLTLTPRVYGRIARDSGDASGTADLVFAGAPGGPVMQALGPGVGKTVGEVGAALDAAVSGNVHLWAGYDGTFRYHAKSHTAKVGLTVSW